MIGYLIYYFLTLTFNGTNPLRSARFFPPKDYIFDSKPDTIQKRSLFFYEKIFPPKDLIFLRFFSGSENFFPAKFLVQF